MMQWTSSINCAGQVNISLCLSCWPVLVGLVFVFVVFCFVAAFVCFALFGSVDLIGIVMTSLDCVSGPSSAPNSWFTLAPRMNIITNCFN